ncbi:DUF2513 domain-containing protein [Singulisphaera sp. Ch08]|uniref:DUF2513 domain-containing protein n=1 Tax=Singulisphaera sp. Ch08 TaxID=3120278 RepID=A0AAU7CF46_9BACT
MKRDMDLARRILLELEECADADGHGWIDIELEGESRESIVYHIRLLYEAGIIEASDCSDMDGADWRAKRLTWEGHEFLDEARNQFVWDKVLSDVKEKGLANVSLDIMKRMLNSELKRRLNIQ